MNCATWVAIILSAFGIALLFAFVLCNAAAEGDRKTEQCRRRANCSAEPNRGLRQAPSYSEAS
jgi:hypothetical protein